ncbi:MAG: flagellar protein FliO/FliZ [Desulfovibrionales bacterium]|nr:flagellar protein FliO/FliZ [Desulfovibrionales bacterium]
MPNATQSIGMVEYGVSPILKTAGSLFLIIALMLVAYYLLKRYGHRIGVGAKFSKDAPQFKGRLSLGPKHQVAVIEFRGKTMLLGVTDHSINLLSCMDDESQSRSREKNAEAFQKAMDQADADSAAD